MEQEYYELIAGRLKQPLHQAVLDPFFYYHLKLNSVDSLEKLPCEKVSGLMNTNKNQIELWLEGKKILKLKLDELNQDQYLIPLYTTNKSIIENTQKPGIYIEQKEIGFIGSYEFQTANFNIKDLQFELLELNNQMLLQNISYTNSKTIFKKKETLITYQNSFLVIS
ncbi:MAG: hypothetical protein ACOYLP_04205 [Flavobacterium sp.]|uniref:hypothetical protein n=1 Tax=Flavobacterium sp. TaxID=239 RepID=UPI003BC20B5F